MQADHVDVGRHRIGLGHVVLVPGRIEPHVMGCEVSLHLQVIIDDLLQHVLLRAGKPRTIAELSKTPSADAGPGICHGELAAAPMHSPRSPPANHEHPRYHVT